MSDKSIGTYNEKEIHSALKKYFCNDESKHEIRVLGYIADIADGQNIVEIQTKQLFKLKNKLETYLVHGYNVRVVHPIILYKTLHWVDPVTNEVVETRKRKTTKSIIDIFIELYGIREILYNKDINFTAIGLSVNEYKYLDGYGQDNKKKATKLLTEPTSIMERVDFSIDSGYEQFIPKTLKNPFTSSEFSKLARCNIKTARTALLILSDLGIISRDGKRGREYIYSYNNKIEKAV